jgi:hypothetical protein
MISCARRNLEGDYNRKHIVNARVKMLIHLTNNMYEDSTLLYPQGNFVYTGCWKACRILFKHSANDCFEDVMVTADKAMGKPNSRIYPIIGWILIGHFTFSLGRTLYMGVPEDALWISHLGTLIGGVGACLRNRRLISLALVSCFGHHAFWVLDTLVWLITGEFAVGATAYLQTRGLSGWIQSSNHFFTVPALLILAVLQGGIDKYAWIWSGMLFLLMVLISLLLLPAASNVNAAHQPWPGTEPLVSHFVPLSPFSPARYILFITAATIFGNYLSTNLVLYYAISKCAGAVLKRHRERAS